MLRLIVISVVLQCCLAQQYQQKVAPGVPPQSYQQQNYQQPPPPPPPQQQQYQQQPPQQQQYQQAPTPTPQQYQQQQVPVQQQQVPVQQQPQGHGGGHDHHGDPMILNTANIAHERDHIQEHMDVPIDTSKMSEQELQFHYFKMHDADNNNKLDGCELIKSLIHWHDQREAIATEEQSYDDNYLTSIVEGALVNDINNDGPEDVQPVAQPSYSDEELEAMVEGALKQTDRNNDGFIDYTEFKSATSI